MSIRQLALDGYGANLQIGAQTSSGREVVLTGINGRPGWFTFVDGGYQYETNIDEWAENGPWVIFQTPTGKKFSISTTSQRTVRLRETARQSTLINTARTTAGPSGGAPTPTPPTTHQVRTWRDGALVCFTNPTTDRVTRTNATDWQLNGNWYWYARRYYTDSI